MLEPNHSNIEISNEKIAEIVHYHIAHESLDSEIFDHYLKDYEHDEPLHEILAGVTYDIARYFFKQGFLLGRQ